MNKIFEELLFSHEEIVARCKELGQEITPDVIKYYECESIIGTLKNLLEERWCKMWLKEMNGGVK